MYRFPKGMYSDVRIEDVFETRIFTRLGTIEESRIREYQGAFLRVFDGRRWYYSSTTSLNDIQKDLDALARLTEDSITVLQSEEVRHLQTNREKKLLYEGSTSIRSVPLSEKHELSEQYLPMINEYDLIRMWTWLYVDRHVKKSFYSSTGSDLQFDTQLCGFALSYDMVHGDSRVSESFQRASDSIGELSGHASALREHLDLSDDFVRKAVPVEAGKYAVVLSPMAAGVFAHESFGHKSEADFMVGDETMKAEWHIGKCVGSPVLSIVDDGTHPGSGYVPFDDEGSRAHRTYIIKDGILTGRLHSASTAAELGEATTGNARALDFQYEPIVRMTTTYILPGGTPLGELFAPIEDGIFVKTINHGSGMSTFTIAPSLAYRIRNGEIAEPLHVSVISGNVMETLGEIEEVSDELEILSFVRGGCGKMEQFPLPVGFGGPHVRVKTMHVQ